VDQHDGTTVDTGDAAVELLVNQVASPVRWDLCMESFADHDVTGIIELARPEPSSASPSAPARRAERRGEDPDDLAAAAAC
jgi:[acyl-carrier-protein] S-malonyltransferase